MKKIHLNLLHSWIKTFYIWICCILELKKLFASKFVASWRKKFTYEFIVLLNNFFASKYVLSWICLVFKMRFARAILGVLCSRLKIWNGVGMREKRTRNIWGTSLPRIKCTYLHLSVRSHPVAKYGGPSSPPASMAHPGPSIRRGGRPPGWTNSGTFS